MLKTKPILKEEPATMGSARLPLQHHPPREAKDHSRPSHRFWLPSWAQVITNGSKGLKTLGLWFCWGQSKSGRLQRPLAICPKQFTYATKQCSTSCHLFIHKQLETPAFVLHLGATFLILFEELRDTSGIPRVRTP